MGWLRCHVGVLRVRSFLDNAFFFPNTVTPFPVFTILFRASSFCFFTPRIPFTLAYLSTLFSRVSRVFFFNFRSLFRRARFSIGVSSPRARRSDGVGAKISSGASIVDTDLAVGSADSRDVAAMFEVVEMVAFGYGVGSQTRRVVLTKRHPPVLGQNVHYTKHLASRKHFPKVVPAPCAPF
jgi:hypothetical protein